MTPALLPVKQLSDTKSRLGKHLSRKTVEQLTLAMLEDLIETLLAVHVIDEVAVVTPDTHVASRATSCGARAILRNDSGLNPSLDAATAELVTRGADRLLVVLGDVAGALPKDIATMFDALGKLGGRGVVLAPSSDGGTSALLRAPVDAIENAFGDQSATTHRRLAEANRLPYRELDLPSLAIDLDQIGDIPELFKSEGAPRTQKLLRALVLPETE